MVSTCVLQAQTKKYQIAPGIGATIIHNADTRLVQVLMAGVETIELELPQGPETQYQIKCMDFNFDGYKDFALVSVNQSTGTQVYEIFIYHYDEKTFEALEVPGGICEVFGNVRLNPGEKTLKSSCHAGPKSSADIFHWASAFNLEFVKSVDNSKEAQTEKSEEKAELKTEKAEEKEDMKQEKQEDRKDKKEKKKEDKEDKSDGD